MDSRIVGVAAGLVLVTVFAYAPVTGHEFLNYDDDVYVTRNEVVREGLTPGGLAWAATTTHAANWHPLTWISHMLDVEWFGLRPGGHHATSVMIHIGSTLLLLVFLVRATGARWPSALVASLFALHPLHVESVAWIAERKDVLSGFFAMATLWAYTEYVRRPGPARYAAVVVTFALGLLSKPMLVTLPFALLLLDAWPLGRLGDPVALPRVVRAIREKLPLFALSALSGWVTIVAQRRAGTITSVEASSIADRAANAAVAYARYLGKTFWPADLAVFYPLPPDWSAGVVAGSALLLAALTAFVVLRARREPWLAVGWFWYLGMLVPVIGLVRVGRQSMADRYTYLPLVGLFLAIVWGVRHLLRARRAPSALIAGLAIAVPLALVPATRAQVGHWKNSIALFTHALAVTRANDEAHFNLGNALVEAGDEEGALFHFLEARRIRPTDARIHNNIGNRLQTAGRLEEAIDSYREALRLDPDHLLARRNLAFVLLRAGLDGEAATEYRRVVAREPGFATGHFHLGVALTRTGDVVEAERHYRRAIDLDASLAQAHWGLAVASALQGRRDHAEASFAEAVRLDPAYARSRAELDRVLRDATGSPAGRSLQPEEPRP